MTKHLITACLPLLALLVAAPASADVPLGNVGATTSQVSAGFMSGGLQLPASMITPMDETPGAAGQQRFKVILDGEGNPQLRARRGGKYMVIIRIRGVACGRHVCVFTSMQVINLRTKVVVNSATSAQGAAAKQSLTVEASVADVIMKLNGAGPPPGAIALAPPKPPKP